MNKNNLSSIPKNPESTLPPDLRKALSSSPSVEAKWKDLTPIARRDFISWIEGTKQSETRKRRVEKACSMLASGKRRPCCYALVPMNFYKALGGTPKAKATWKELTPDERRDYIDWIEEAKESVEKRNRVEKACMRLVAGKHRP